MDAAAYAVFAAKSGEAVRLWCRHSEVEVGFAAGAPDGSPPPAPEPVRQAFHVDAPFEVELVEEGTQIVAGVARDYALLLRHAARRFPPVSSASRSSRAG